MAVQVMVSLEGENYRVAARNYRDAITHLGVRLGEFNPLTIPDFNQFTDPGLEAEHFLLSTYEGCKVWTIQDHVYSSMQEAIIATQRLNPGYVLRGGTDDDRRLGWARIAETTMAYVTARDDRGLCVGPSGYQRRAELADDGAYDTKIETVCSEIGLDMVCEDYDLRGMDLLSTPDDPYLDQERDMGDWTL